MMVNGSRGVDGMSAVGAMMVATNRANNQIRLIKEYTNDPSVKRNRKRSSQYYAGAGTPKRAEKSTRAIDSPGGGC